MDSRTPSESNKPSQGNDLLGDLVDAGRKGVDLSKRAAKAMGNHFPRVLKYGAKAADFAEKVGSNPTAENIVCGGAELLVEGVTAGSLYSGAAGLGATMGGGPLNPFGAAAGATIFSEAAGPGIDNVTQPIISGTRKGCQAAFDFGRKIAPHIPNPFAEPVIPKQVQTKQAQVNVAQNQASYDAANIHAQQQAHRQVIANTQCFNLPFQFRQYSPMIPMSAVWRVQEQAVWEFKLRYGNVPAYIESQIRNSISVSGLNLNMYNGSYCMSEFSMSLMATNLISSYNIYHLHSSIYSPLGLYGDIGGVASEVSTISDLIDSEAHAVAEDYYLCMPANISSFSDSMFAQIQQELQHAFYEYKALPFFSLHFNQSGFLYPIIHPAYQNTLIGEIIGLLDYFMKGYLNGGVYDPEFLKLWHETANCNEAYLRTKIIDLKKYCKEYAPAVGYLSLRELESRYDLKGEHGSSAYQQPFMTSFRIIAYQKKIGRHNNVLIPHPDFKVEYSVDLMPDYQQYVDAHVKEHGQLPPEYKQVRECYEMFAEEVKQKMPQLPLCRDFFNLLGVINSLCYFYTTLEKMGKRPVLNSSSTDHSPFPKSLPPIPVRHYKSYDFPLTMNDILKHICHSPAATDVFNKQLSGLFLSQADFPVELRQQIELFVKTEVLSLMRKNLPGESLTELNDEDITRITKQACHILKSSIHTYSGMMESEIHELLDKSIPVLKVNELVTIMDMSLPDKISYIRQRVILHLAAIMESWTTKVRKSSTKDSLTDLWDETKGVVTLAIEQYNDTIIVLRTSMEAELAKLTPEQKRHPAAKTLAEMIDKEVAEFSVNIKRLKEIEDSFKESSWLSGFSGLTGMPPIKFGKKTRNVIVDAIKLIETYTSELYQAHTEIINGFSEKLLKIEPLTSHVISKKYTHTFIGFTGKELAQKTGDNFNIVGGCGMSLPNMTSQPIPHAEVFCKAVAESLSASKSNKGRFVHNGIEYMVYQLPVYSIDTENVIESILSADQVNALRALHSEMASEVSTGSISKNLVGIAINEDGETLMHLAASNLPTRKFSDVVKTAPDILLLQDKYGNLPIHSAAKAGHVEAVSEMLARNPGLLEAKNKRGQTPVMIAVQFGQQSVMEALRQADFNYCLPNGLFPLFMSIQRNFIPLTFWMLDNIRNLDVNKELDSKMTALHLSIQSGATELAIKLYRLGARYDIRRKSDGFTAVHCAAQLGNVEVLKTFFLNNAVSAELPLESKKTLLHLAAAAGRLEAVKLLLQQGANINAQTIECDTPLMLAIVGGHAETAELLAKTAAINSINRQQQTASMLAQQYRSAAVGDVLISRGEDPNLADKNGKTYLYYLIRNGEYQRFKQLIEMRKVKIWKIINGNSLLALAAQFGHFMIVYDLLDRKAHYTSSTKFSLMDYAVMADEIGYLTDRAEEVKQPDALALQAVKSGSVRCLKFLLKKLSPTACQHPDLVRAAIASNNEGVMTLILNHYHHINKPVDKEGNTLLHIAAKHGAHLALPMLAKRGCQFTAINLHKQTAFHLAVKQEDDDLLKKLFKLSTPEEWPLDLWQPGPQEPTSTIKKLLMKYKKRLPLVSAVSKSLHDYTVAAANQEAALPTCPILTTKQLATISNFKKCISQRNFDKAAFLIDRNSFFASLFKTDKGGELFQHIVKAIKDINPLNLGAAIFNSEDTSKQLFPVIDRLFTLLQAKGVNPAKFTGEANPLIPVVMADKDNHACYRLKALAHYFPDCVPALVMDKCFGGTTITQIALSHNKLGLFEQLDGLCSQHAEGNSKSFSALHEAVLANQYELVERLLKRYPVNSVNHQGITPLMLAAAKGNVSIINLLLQHGANVDDTDLQSQSVLHYALEDKSSEAGALTLLPLIKNPNKPNRKGVTPLMIAANKGMVSVMRSLCEASHEDLQTFDSQGHNALHHAALAGQAESIIYLVSKGFHVDQPESPQKPDKPERCHQRTPLHMAALRGHEQAIYSLLELKADPTKEDAQGNALCEYAVLGKNKEVLNLMRLLPYFNNKDRNRHLLHAAARADNTDILSELILDNANLNSLNKNGLSALHIACINNSGDMARLLLSGGDLVLNGLDKMGNAPVHYAAQFGHVRLLELLRAAGADMNQINAKGETPITIAKAYGKAGAVLALDLNNAETNGHITPALMNFGLYRRNISHVSDDNKQLTTADKPANSNNVK